MAGALPGRGVRGAVPTALHVPQVANVWSKLNNALHFVELQHFRDGFWLSILSINMSIASYNGPVTLFVFCVRSLRTAQHSQTQYLALAQFWTCRWAVQNWFVFVKIHFLILGGNVERKSSSEDRKAINMENVEVR